MTAHLSRHGRRLLGVIALTAASASPACAIIVGDVDGTLLLGSDASSRDASSRDSTSGDARADRRISADATDATTSDARPDAAADAPHADVADAHIVDAGSDAHDGGFCANFVHPDGATVFCDDFDEIADAGYLGSPIIVGDGSAAHVQSVTAFSGPNALFTSANPGDAASLRQVYFDRRYNGVTRVTLQFDLYVAELSAGMSQTTSTIALAAGASSVDVGLGLMSTMPGYYTVTARTTAPEAGMALDFHNVGEAKIGEWARVSLTVAPTAAGGYTETLVVKDSGVDDAAPIGRLFDFSALDARLGISFASGGGLRNMYFDNIVLVIQ